MKGDEVEKLKGSLNNGFIIGRGGKGYGSSLGWGSRGGRSSDIASFVKKKRGRKQGDVVIYKNAGILVGKDRRGEACGNNNQKTRYFPLDIK
ncbi:hypothetical protein WEN_02550 [Mycoplasma wenyonii str. Massachusetts]|uniref:Uncharacterized protein n=1 Tax=Mycoplasma wenyonii (strain Massachusetts) TaxID=1197325 RepID=I6ZJD0_MYCWM|nr:hypothetical protein [Mycoplasma wenyonii]AFN65295.1 hypothetical protein WEN_02550 [Mycoplasma wenyonii str. Massachusetts]